MDLGILVKMYDTSKGRCRLQGELQQISADPVAADTRHHCV